MKYILKEFKLYSVLLILSALILIRCEFLGLSGLGGDPQLVYKSDTAGLCFQYYVDKKADPEIIKTQIQLHKVNMLLQKFNIEDLTEVADCKDMAPIASCLERMEAKVGKNKVLIESERQILYNKTQWADTEKARRDCSTRTGSSGKFVAN